MSVRAVLLDSGGVLMGPKGGRWNPRLDFEDNLRHSRPDIAADAIDRAIAAVEPAFPVYRDYYRALLRELSLDPNDETLLDALLPDRPPTEFVERP